tara:strand:- start:335 stop:499 length:165 start_codon:yes stop_codon:yes gene_type:complete
MDVNIMNDDEFKIYVAQTINVLIEAIERLSKKIVDLDNKVMAISEVSNSQDNNE